LDYISIRLVDRSFDCVGFIRQGSRRKMATCVL